MTRLLLRCFRWGIGTGRSRVQCSAPAVVALIAFRAGTSIIVGIRFLLVANACVALMLWRARASISRLWSATAR